MTSSSSRAAPREGGTAHPEQEPPRRNRRSASAGRAVGPPSWARRGYSLPFHVKRTVDGPSAPLVGTGRLPARARPGRASWNRSCLASDRPRDAPVGNSWPTVSSAIRPPFGSGSVLHRVVRAPRPVLFGRGAHPVQRNHPTPPDAPREARGLDPRLGPVVWGSRPLRPARSTINGIARSRNSRDGAPTQPKGSGLRPRVSRARAPRGVPDAGGWPPAVEVASAGRSALRLGSAPSPQCSRGRHRWSGAPASVVRNEDQHCSEFREPITDVSRETDEASPPDTQSTRQIAAESVVGERESTHGSRVRRVNLENIWCGPTRGWATLARVPSRQRRANSAPVHVPVSRVRMRAGSHSAGAVPAGRDNGTPRDRPHGARPPGRRLPRHRVPKGFFHSPTVGDRDSPRSCNPDRTFQSDGLATVRRRGSGLQSWTHRTVDLVTPAAGFAVGAACARAIARGSSRPSADLSIPPKPDEWPIAAPSSAVAFDGVGRRFT